MDLARFIFFFFTSSSLCWWFMIDAPKCGVGKSRWFIYSFRLVAVHETSRNATDLRRLPHCFFPCTHLFLSSSSSFFSPKNEEENVNYVKYVSIVKKKQVWNNVGKRKWFAEVESVVIVNSGTSSHQSIFGDQITVGWVFNNKNAHTHTHNTHVYYCCWQVIRVEREEGGEERTDGRTDDGPHGPDLDPSTSWAWVYCATQREWEWPHSSII